VESKSVPDFGAKEDRQVEVNTLILRGNSAQKLQLVTAQYNQNIIKE
jgi:hypothetical protein